MISCYTILEEFSAISAIIRLVLSAVLGALIGVERGTKRRPAGLRTFSLVCLGSALSMVTNQFLVEQYNGGDPSRLAAQVISGIGFLGIGTIVVTGKNYVRGLTTAATLWVTATLGIAIGAGFIYGGMITFILIMIIIRALSIVSRHQEQYNRMIGLCLEVDQEFGSKTVLGFIHERNYSISYIEKSKKTSLVDKAVVIIVELDMKKKYKHDLLISELSQLDCVYYVEEIC